MRVLGIHDGHSSSAALIEDGKVVAAIQEERLTRNKNQGGFPHHAIQEVLKIGGCSLTDLDAAAFCGYSTVFKHNTREEGIASTHRKFEPIRHNFMRRFEIKVRGIRNTVWPGLRQRHREKDRKKKQRQRRSPLAQQGFPLDKIHFVEHHQCHAAAAYYGQGDMNEPVLVITCDAAGDSLCASVQLGQHAQMERLAQVPRADAVAMIYGLITYYLGFVPLEHEYKLMGMAPYASDSRQAKSICDYFHSLFRFVPDQPLLWQRTPGTPPTFKLGPVLKEILAYKRFDHIAGGLQKFTEEFMRQWIHNVVQATGVGKLALSGGIFMNVKLNKLIMELPDVESLFVFPSCGDESNSIGAAWEVYANLAQAQNQPIASQPLGPVYWGGGFSDAEVEQAIAAYAFTKKVEVRHYENIEQQCAELLARGQVVARFKGRMEFGARALGNRSILADPGNWQTIHRINAMIKKRDFWMPFAPSMLAECADDYIVNSKAQAAPYMILAFDAKPGNVETIVAATHPYDKSCRPQIVEKSHNPGYHRLLTHYRELTGHGAILNTSFNLHGFPIVYRPQEALQVFDNSGLKYLAIENFLVREIDNN